MQAEGSDLDGLTDYAVGAWINVAAAKEGDTLLRFTVGETDAWTLGVAGCEGKGMRVQTASGADLGSTTCVHRLADKTWAFVAYVQKAGTGSIYLDGAPLGSGPASGALFGSATGARHFRTGAGVALGWSMLIDRAATRDELATLRSQGPAVWLDGMLMLPPGASNARPRDYADFVHRGNGERVRAFDANWNEVVNAVKIGDEVVVIPEDGRFGGGKAAQYTWVGTVRVPDGNATVQLLRHAVAGKVQERLRLLCAPLQGAAGRGCRLEMSTDFSYTDYAKASRWESASFAITGAATTIELRLAVALNGGVPMGAVSARDAVGGAPVQLRIGADTRDGSTARPLGFYVSPKKWTEFVTPQLSLPNKRSGLLIDAAVGSAIGLRDNRVYARALGDAELQRAATQDCAGQGCSALLRSCSIPKAGGAVSMPPVGSLSACAGCVSGTYDDAGTCLPKAGFRGACSYAAACQSGLCVGGYCRANSADAGCADGCRKLGRACVAVQGGGFECGSTCLANFTQSGSVTDPISGLPAPTCTWAPKTAVGDACTLSANCESAVCATQTTTAYNVTNTNTKLKEPRYENPVKPPYKNTPTGPWETCTSAAQCAVAAPYTTALNVCAAKTNQQCRQQAMQGRLVKAKGWDGVEREAYVCEGCLKDTYQGGAGDPLNGQPLYVQAWSMLSPQACRAIHDAYFKLLSNGKIVIGGTTYSANKDGWADSYARWPASGDILAHAPEISRLRKLLLNDPDPTSKPTPATLSKLEQAGVGRVFLDPKYSMHVYSEYMATKSWNGGMRPEHLRLNACAMKSYKGTNEEGWELANPVQSKFFDQALNRPVCVENKFPNGTPCPPGGSAKTYTRANAGLFCSSGFCAADTKVCETGYQGYEEVHGRARNDGNDGGGGNDLGPIALVQDNGSVFRFDQVDATKVKLVAGTTDHRHVFLEAHSKDTIHIFGWSADVLDMSVSVLESPGAADVSVRANVSQEFLVCGLQLPSLPKLPKATCGAVQFENGAYKAPTCKLEKTSVGVTVKHNPQSQTGGKTVDNEKSVSITDGGLVPTITYNIPIPLEECPKNLDGFKMVMGRACFAKKTFVGPVPFKVEAKVEPVASVKFGAELDSETFEPAAKLTPSIGLALEVKGGVGGDIGPLELFAGIKGVVTIIEAALPVSFGLSFVQMTANGSAITDLWEVRKAITGRFELNFLKLALGVFFEIGAGPIKVELEYTFFSWDGIGLSWKLGEFVADRYKVDFQWDSYATSTSAGHGGGQ